MLDHQVFVFGSNSTGFHGAGAAGLACRGDAKNTWRTDKWFLAAMKSPPNSKLRIGKWAVYGQPRGFQRGKEGRSYAIQTIVKPGLKRSTSLEEIRNQLINLCSFARVYSSLEFLISAIGEGYAGYTKEEMDSVWNSLDIPPNFTFLERRKDNDNT